MRLADFADLRMTVLRNIDFSQCRRVSQFSVKVVCFVISESMFLSGIGSSRKKMSSVLLA